MDKIEIDQETVAESIEAKSEADVKKRWNKMVTDATKSDYKKAMFNEGYQDGVKHAASDYLSGKVSTELLDAIEEDRNMLDNYSLGYEIGYNRKLAEILVG